MLGVTTTMEAVSTGKKAIAAAVEGDIDLGSLVIIRGESGSGKSMLCQHIAHSTLQSSQGAAAYYTEKKTFRDLITEMDSFSLPVEHQFVTDKLRIHPLASPEFKEGADNSVRLLIGHISAMPARFKLIIVDSLTPFMIKMDAREKMDMFQAFKELCGQGRTIVLVAGVHVFDKGTVNRAYFMSDYFFNLKGDDAPLWAGEVDSRRIKILEALKLRGAEIPSGGAVKFEIKERVGIQILPFMQVKI